MLKYTPQEISYIKKILDLPPRIKMSKLLWQELNIKLYKMKGLTLDEIVKNNRLADAIELELVRVIPSEIPEEHLFKYNTNIKLVVD